MGSHAWGLAGRPSSLQGRSQRHRARPRAQLAPCSLDGEPHITVSQGCVMLLVLHPDTLISSTSIASALDCPCEAILKEHGYGRPSREALMGSMMHASLAPKRFLDLYCPRPRSSLFGLERRQLIASQGAQVCLSEQHMGSCDQCQRALRLDHA
jgi:hypothetical protein